MRYWQVARKLVWLLILKLQRCNYIRTTEYIYEIVIVSISNMRYVRFLECPFQSCRHASPVLICRCVEVECIDYCCVPVRGFSSVQQKILSGRDMLLYWVIPRLLNFVIVQNLSRLDVFQCVRSVVLWFFLNFNNISIVVIRDDVE